MNPRQESICQLKRIFRPLRKRTGYRVEMVFGERDTESSVTGSFFDVDNGDNFHFMGLGVFPQSKTILFHALVPEIPLEDRAVSFFLMQATKIILHEYCHILAATSEEKALPNLGLSGAIPEEKVLEQEAMAQWLEKVIFFTRPVDYSPPTPTRIAGLDVVSLKAEFQESYRRFRVKTL